MINKAWKRPVVWMLCLMMLSINFVGCKGQDLQQTAQSITEEKNTMPKKKANGEKYRIAYVDYDEYLPASQQFYYIVLGLKNLGWITCEELPFTEAELSTEEMYALLADTDLGDYLEFVEDAFYYLGYEKSEDIAQSLIAHTEEKKDIDLVLTFGTSAGKFVRDLGLSVPMVDFSATDPVASGIIDSAENGSGNDMVWAQTEPSMPLRQLKYYYSIKSFEKLGIVVYGDELISGVPDIEKASEEIGFQLEKKYIGETLRETEDEKKHYYKLVQREFEKLAEDGIDAFFLTVDLINDMERLSGLLDIFYQEDIPVYVMDDVNTVKNGALMIISTYDFENVGYFIADAVAQILNGADVGILPCVYTSAPYICLNYDVAKKISYPLDLKFLLSCDEICQEKSAYEP